MSTKRTLLKQVSKLERELSRLREEIENLEKEDTVSLEGKFPELSTITSQQIDNSTKIWDKEFEKTLNDL